MPESRIVSDNMNFMVSIKICTPKHGDGFAHFNVPLKLGGLSFRNFEYLGADREGGGQVVRCSMTCTHL
jgi:hypothetical protein